MNSVRRRAIVRLIDSSLSRDTARVKTYRLLTYSIIVMRDLLKINLKLSGHAREVHVYRELISRLLLGEKIRDTAK